MNSTARAFVCRTLRAPLLSLAGLRFAVAPSRARRRAIVVAIATSFASVFTTAACRKAARDTTDAAPPRPSEVPQSPLDKASTEAAWVAARGGDPLELARLADGLGGEVLAGVAGDARADPDDRATAIRAIAYVDDPTTALDALTALAREPSVQRPSDRSTLALETLADVSSHRRPVEEHDPSAWGRSAESLLDLVERLSGDRRSAAIRALVGMAERGAIDPKRIPDG